MSAAKTALLVAVMIGLTLGASGCREDEQDRPLVDQKGVYEGQPDEELGDDTIMDLKSRAAGQQF